MYFHAPAHFGEPVLTYTDPFPNIRDKMPGIYQAAMAAQERYNMMKWFKDVYEPLSIAAGAAHLALDSQDRIVVIPDQRSVEQLLGPKIVESVLKRSGKSLVRELVGADFARALGIAEHVLRLFDIAQREHAKRLVNEQRGSMRDEAYRYKLNFFIHLRIRQLAPQADPVMLAGRMTTAYYAYEKTLGELTKYQNMEQNLKEGMSPSARRPQYYKPVPQGL
jgi:hypothetical protein